MANSALAVCRVCLADSIRMHSIRNTLYQEMFEKLSGTKLITEDGRPDTVCYICNSQLRKFCSMYLMSQNSEQKLTKLLRGGKKLTKRKMSLLERETYNLSITTMKNMSTEDIPVTPEDILIETSENSIKSITTNDIPTQPKEKPTRTVLEHLMYEHSYSLLSPEMDELCEMDVDFMDEQTYEDDTNNTVVEGKDEKENEKDVNTNAEEESVSDLLCDERIFLDFVRDEPLEVALTVTKPPAKDKKSEMLALDIALKAEMEKLCGIEIGHETDEQYDEATATTKTETDQITNADVIQSTQTAYPEDKSTEIKAQVNVTPSSTEKTHSRNLRSSDSKKDELDASKKDKSSDIEKANATTSIDKTSDVKIDKASKLRRAYLRHTSIDMKPIQDKPRNTRKTQLRNRSTDSDTAVNETSYEPEKPVEAKTAEKPATSKITEKSGDKTAEKSSNIGKAVKANKSSARKGRNRSSGGSKDDKLEITPVSEKLHMHNTRKSNQRNKHDTLGDKADTKNNKNDTTDKNANKDKETKMTNIRKSLRNVLKKKEKGRSTSKTAHMVGKSVGTGKISLKKKSYDTREFGTKSTDTEIGEVDVTVETLDLDNGPVVIETDVHKKKSSRTEDDPMDAKQNIAAEITRNSILHDWIDDDEPSFETQNEGSAVKVVVESIADESCNILNFSMDRLFNKENASKESPMKRKSNEEKAPNESPKTRAKTKKTVKKIKDFTNDHGCELCPSSFDTLDDLRKHQSQKHKSYCFICCKKLSNAGHLRNHMLIHTGEKPFVCKVCGKRTNNKSNLTKHLNVHKENKLFCVICNRVISMDLAEHMMKVHQGNEESSNTDLKEATNAAEEEDPPDMDLEKPTNAAEKEDSPKADVKNPASGAKKRDVPNKKLKKRVLGKSTKLKKITKARKGKSMRNKRKGLHIITGKVTCTKCGMRFSSLSTLEEHYKAHNRNAPFSCDICSEKFNHLILLKRHVVVHIM